MPQFPQLGPETALGSCWKDPERARAATPLWGTEPGAALIKQNPLRAGIFLPWEFFAQPAGRMQGSCEVQHQYLSLQMEAINPRYKIHTIYFLSGCNQKSSIHLYIYGAINTLDKSNLFKSQLPLTQMHLVRDLSPVLMVYAVY